MHFLPHFYHTGSPVKACAAVPKLFSADHKWLVVDYQVVCICVISFIKLHHCVKKRLKVYGFVILVILLEK